MDEAELLIERVLQLLGLRLRARPQCLRAYIRKGSLCAIAQGSVVMCRVKGEAHPLLCTGVDAQRPDDVFFVNIFSIITCCPSPSFQHLIPCYMQQVGSMQVCYFNLTANDSKNTTAARLQGKDPCNW